MDSFAPPPFLNRVDAGLQLAAVVVRLRDAHPTVVAIAPTSVPVALVVASELGAPLGTVVVEPIGRSHAHPIGAAADSGPAVIHSARAQALGISREELSGLARAAISTARRRARRYLPGPSLAQRTVVLVDDDTRDGLSLLAAVRAVRRRGASRIVLATPTLSFASGSFVRSEVDAEIRVFATSDPQRPFACYEDARALTDEDALSLVTTWRPSVPPPCAPASRSLSSPW